MAKTCFYKYLEQSISMLNQQICNSHILFKRYYYNIDDLIREHGVLVLIGSHLMNLEGRENMQADS